MSRISPLASQLRENAKDDAEAARDLGQPEKYSEAFAHADALTATGRVFQMAPATGEKDDADHPSQEQQAEVGEAGELREHGVSGGTD